MPTTDTRDPLDERPRGERCDQCAGTGWVQVKAAYAVHLFPDPTHAQLAGLTEGEAQAVNDATAERRRFALDSVYPCRECAPAMFFRWAGGHFKMGHDPGSCTECIEVTGHRRPGARRPSKPRPIELPPEPKPAREPYADD